MTKNGEHDDFTFYSQKQGALLLKPRKPTKMAGVTQAKPPLVKNTFVATPKVYRSKTARQQTNNICVSERRWGLGGGEDEKVV